MQTMGINRVKPEPARSPPARNISVVGGFCECGGRLLTEIKQERVSPAPSPPAPSSPALSPPPQSPMLSPGVSPPRLGLYSPFQALPIEELYGMLEFLPPWEEMLEEAELEEGDEY